MHSSAFASATKTLIFALVVAAAPLQAGGLDKINGTPGDDVLVGTDADERLNGKAGNDSIDGGAGSDEVQAASGDDTGIYGFRENAGAEDDYKGGSGFDQLVIIIPDDVTAAVEVPLLQAAVDAFNAFLAATTGEGQRFFFSAFGFDLTVRGFEDLETNVVAVDDTYVTDEDTPLSVPAPGVLGNEINLDGDPLSVTAVDGNAGSVDNQIVLASGALLTVAADGSVDYDPNGQFESLAMGDLDSDEFDYTASDGTFASSALVTLTIVGVNDPPVADDAAFAVDENVADGTFVGTVSASDVDAGDSLSFAITGGNVGGAFAIGAASGAITVNNPPGLDFETLDAYSLTVTVTDSFGAFDDATVDITVNDLNEAPTANDAAFSVDENVADGTNVGTVTASDPDAGDTLSFAITAGNTGGAFAIGGASGAITVNNPPGLDFESLNNYSLTVTVTDSGGLMDTATVDIMVDNVNEAPTADDAAFSVDENVADGTSVGTVTASDPDAGDTLSFSITGGNVGGAFSIGSASGAITVNNPPGLDFESLNAYSLTVTVTDNGGLTDMATVDVTVNDVPEGGGPLPNCLLTGAPAPYFCDVAQPAGSLGAGMVAATGAAIPGRTCNTDGLCSTDSQYLPAASSLTVNADGSFSLHYETNQCPLFPAGALILEFEITVGAGAPFVVDLFAKAIASNCP